MTTINLMATGAFYACGRDEKQCRDYLEHLENDKPTMALVENKNTEYGVVIDVMEESRKVASIGRLDIGTALSAMKLENEETLMADVESVCYDGKYFTLKVDLENEVENSIYTACDWSRWEPLDLPMLSPSEKVQSVCSASKVLKSLMKKGRKENAGLMMPYLKSLTENCRCDVTKETQDALRMTRGYLEQCKDRELRDYAREVVHAINGLGSQKREEEYEEYWAELTESNEALVMMNQWMMLQDTDGSDEQMADIIDKQIKAIDRNLRQLPNRLYFSINDPAKLLHLLVYAYIPRNKWQALMTELVLKKRLKTLSPLSRKGESLQSSEGAEASPPALSTRKASPPALSFREGAKASPQHSFKGEGAEAHGALTLEVMANPESDNFEEKEELTFNEMIAQAIDQTFFKLRIKKKEFKILHKLVNEKYDKQITMSAFADLIKEYCSFAEEYMPSWNNIRQLDISESSTYPNWKFHGVTALKAERYLNIAKVFSEFLA